MYSPGVGNVDPEPGGRAGGLGFAEGDDGGSVAGEADGDASGDCDAEAEGDCDTEGCPVGSPVADGGASEQPASASVNAMAAAIRDMRS